jgi:predicted Zn-dependent protease
MKKPQYLALLAAALMFAVLYFGFDTKPTKQKTIEQSRAIKAESTSMEVLVEAGRKMLNPTQISELAELESAVSDAPDDAKRSEAFKKLSGWWYRNGQKAVAGGVAESVAELDNSATAWSVAGATFYEALISEADPSKRDFCARRAVKAFESATSLAPETVEHRVNLALVYAEYPQMTDNAMQAVLMLRDLEAKYPEAPSVYNALGRLAIKTGQWQRAVDRLEKAWLLDKSNANTPCLLAKAYEGLGNVDKTAEFTKLCKQ